MNRPTKVDYTATKDIEDSPVSSIEARLRVKPSPVTIDNCTDASVGNRLVRLLVVPLLNDLQRMAPVS